MKPKSIEQQSETLNIHPDEIPDGGISNAIKRLSEKPCFSSKKSKTCSRVIIGDTIGMRI